MSLQLSKTSETMEKAVQILWCQSDKNRYSDGIDCLREILDQEPDAHYFLGWCYFYGKMGVKRDQKTAYELFKKGASLGSDRCVLGAVRANLFDIEFQRVVKSTFVECFQRIYATAEKNDGVSAYQIAQAYDWKDTAKIEEIADQSEKCVHWYKIAAKQNILPAIQRLGNCYFTGKYVEKNLEKTFYWANKAAELGSAWGFYQIGRHYYEQKEYGKAVPWLEKASTQGDASAPYLMGMLYKFGYGTAPDTVKSIYYFRIAAGRGEARAMYRLGNAYFYGKDVDKNYDHAFYWLSSSYRAGNKNACVNLSFLYNNGLGCDKDVETGIRLLREAAEIDENGYAHFELGWRYETGNGLPVDLDQAAENYQIAIQLGDKGAQKRFSKFKKNLFGNWKIK